MLRPHKRGTSLAGRLAAYGDDRHETGKDAVRTSARADLPVHDRNVGALLLLRHARHPGALPDQDAVHDRSFRSRHRLSGTASVRPMADGFDRHRPGAERNLSAAIRLADLWRLY